MALASCSPVVRSVKSTLTVYPFFVLRIFVKRANFAVVIFPSSIDVDSSRAAFSLSACSFLRAASDF